VTGWLLIAAPMVVIAVYSLLTRGDYGGVEEPWTVESFTRLADTLYLGILWRSVWISAAATAICALMGIPLALYNCASREVEGSLPATGVAAFWTSFLVRTYAWLFILRDTGLVNTALTSLHLIRAPLPLLYNDGAVLLGLVYSFLPFFVLPVYATLERMDPALVEAAADLGATPGAALRRVILPLARPGIAAGCRIGLCAVSGCLPDAGPAGGAKP